MTPRIPIQNIYYLLIYGWDRLAEGELVDVSGIDSTELVDLYAAVLLNGIRHLLRRGLDQAYLPVEAEIAGIRGRVQIAATARRMLAQHGRAYCEYDELSVDTLPNRILRATLRRLIMARSLDKGLRDQLRELDRSLGGITPIHLERSAFRTVQLHSNNGFYRFLLSLCELILDSSISTEEHGSFKFKDFVRDPSRMAQLFERFAFNFYRRECLDADVKRERIYWAAGSADDPDLTLLPTMQTDISLRRPGRTLVIDAKYYQETLQRHFGSETVHSANLYQMFSYLKNLEPRGGQDAEAEGMLLYPVVERRLRLSYEIAGHKVRICTVDLAQDWKAIRRDLLELVA
jgi:5-methylcytosine-specific restriction enzyme subunit McrC